jgi:uncharacterized phage protein (TIGR01671 family)
MREIIFRAWSEKRGGYDYNVNVNAGHPVRPGYQWYSNENDIYDSELEQYTGLTDTNGKKIFEGDIVRFIWWWFDGAERESELTGTIVYSSDNMSFQLKGVKNKEWRDFVGADEHDMDYLTPFSELNFCDADFEVIGNIHDNPELLT